MQALPPSRVRTWLVPHIDLDPPQPGEIVRCGPAGAVWRVVGVEGGSSSSAVDLEPVDPHDVPPMARVRELPIPVGTVPDDSDLARRMDAATVAAGDALRSGATVEEAGERGMAAGLAVPAADEDTGTAGDGRGERTT